VSRRLRGKTDPLEGQESVSGGGQRRVMMPSAPPPSLKVVETEFALELLVVAFDPPAELREIDESSTRRSRR